MAARSSESHPKRSYISSKGWPRRATPTFDSQVASHPKIAFLRCLSVQFRSSLTLAHSTMTGMLIRAFQNRNTAFTRWLGLLLVVFILYGTTVEAAHRHGRVLPDNGAASLVDADHSTSPVAGKSGCSDCLICQLHQNFTTTLIVFRLVDPPEQARIKIPNAIPPDILSPLIGPTAGRAPPSIS